MRILEQDGGVAIGNAVAKCPTLRHLDLGQILGMIVHDHEILNDLMEISLD